VTYSEGFLKEASPPTRLDIKFSQSGLDQAAKTGIAFTQDVPVSAEAQQVRVIVLDPALNDLGSVTFAVKQP
jgi:hypothetical protein